MNIKNFSKITSLNNYKLLGFSIKALQFPEAILNVKELGGIVMLNGHYCIKPSDKKAEHCNTAGR